MELNENEIKKYLSGSLGKDLVLYETIDSANNAAKLLAKNGAPHGSVVLSRQQTAGKGRLGRRDVYKRQHGYFTLYQAKMLP